MNEYILVRPDGTGRKVSSDPCDIPKPFAEQLDIFGNSEMIPGPGQGYSYVHVGWITLGTTDRVAGTLDNEPK